MILITSMDSLPEHCYECPCHDGESGYCQADREHRYSDYRPYWCPLKDLVLCEDCIFSAKWPCVKNSDGVILCTRMDNGTKHGWFCADGKRK